MVFKFDLEEDGGKLTFRQYASIVIILLILLFHRSVFPLVIAEKNPNAPFQLTVFHMNDVHSRVEQFPLLKTALDEMRHQAKHSLFLHAGDEFTGTLYFSTYHGFSDLDFLNQLQVDAFTIGNHEFDKGPDLLAMFIAKAQFPSLSANIDFTKEQVLDRLFRNKIAQKPKNGKIYPGIIKEFNGEKIGIFGLITEETPTISNPGSNLVFENAVEQGKRIIQQFQRKGVNKIILLSHLGLKQDKKIAEEVEGIDIIVGGHSHTELKKPVVIQKSEPTVIVQATPHLKSLGKLAVTFNQQGKIIDYNGELIYLTEDRFQKIRIRAERFTL